MPRRDAVSWNVMISGYAEVYEGEEALDLYTQMEQDGVLPDVLMYVGTLRASGSIAGLEKGKETHARILNTEEEAIHLFLASSLIDMYGKCGCMADAQQVFDSLPSRDLVTWSALMAGYARHGESEVVFDLFQRLRLEGMQPNSVTFLSVVTVCSHAGLVKKGCYYFEVMSRHYGIFPDLDHYTCIIDLQGRAGHLDTAMSTLKAMPFQPDCAVWQTVLAACHKWGNAELSKIRFRFSGWVGSELCLRVHLNDKHLCSCQDEG